MATSSASAEPPVATGPDWLSGVAAGIVAAVIVGIVVWVGFDAAIIEEDIPDPFGLTGAAAGWGVLLVIGILAGVIYSAMNAVEAIDAWASTARTGAILGLAYGVVLWLLAVVTIPLISGDGLDGIGDYAVSADGILGYALFGVVIGFLYLLIPVLRNR